MQLKRSLRPWYTNVIPVIVSYSPCIVIQYSGGLARHMSSRDSVVERPTYVPEVIYTILCLRMFLYML